MIQKLFKDFINLNEVFDGQLLEISVKQHQIVLLFNESVYFNDLERILKNSEDYTESYISIYENYLCVIVGGFSDDLNKQNEFYNFLLVIRKMSQEICQCPALEYVVSAQYIKCYLDKTGLGIEDLIKYEEILGAKDKGELEMHPQRPYFLFINEGDSL